MGTRFWQTLRLGLKSLLLHKLRSGLAILGIFIGVTAVIWLVAMGEGVSYQAQQQIKDLGANNIIIRSTKPPAEVTRGGGFVIAYGLLRDDYDRIVSNVPTLLQAVPMREISKELRYMDKVSDARIVGCTAKYMDINNLQGRTRALSQRQGSGRGHQRRRDRPRSGSAAVSLSGSHRQVPADRRRSFTPSLARRRRRLPRPASAAACRLRISMATSTFR